MQRDQSEDALLRETLCPCCRRLGNADSRQASLLRAVGRAGCRPCEVPSREGCLARWTDAAPGNKRSCSQGFGERLPRSQAGAARCRRVVTLGGGDYKTACDEIMVAFSKGRRVSDLRPKDFATLHADQYRGKIACGRRCVLGDVSVAGLPGKLDPSPRVGCGVAASDDNPNLCPSTTPGEPLAVFARRGKRNRL